MKQIKNSLTFVILITLLSSCASMKLTKNWESNSFENTKKEKILVASRATDIEFRKAFEQEIVSKLKNEGVNAVAAYKTFPDLKDKKNRSEEEINQIVTMFKSKGINAVLSTSLKDTKVLKSSPDKKVSNNTSTANIGKYGVSFAGYYNVSSVEYLSRNLIPIDDLKNTEPTIELSSTTCSLQFIIRKRQTIGRCVSY